jgi:hypothetical protein
MKPMYITVYGQRARFSGSPEQCARMKAELRAINGARLAALMRARP